MSELNAKSPAWLPLECLTSAATATVKLKSQRPFPRLTGSTLGETVSLCCCCIHHVAETLARPGPRCLKLAPVPAARAVSGHEMNLSSV